jgi:hypothetical protein
LLRTFTIIYNPDRDFEPVSDSETGHLLTNQQVAKQGAREYYLLIMDYVFCGVGSDRHRESKAAEIKKRSRPENRRSGEIRRERGQECQKEQRWELSEILCAIRISPGARPPTGAVKGAKAAAAWAVNRKAVSKEEGSDLHTSAIRRAAPEA